MASRVQQPPVLTPRTGPQAGGVVVDTSAQNRLVAIAVETGAPAVLRLAVAGGGCSGFQYELTLDAPDEDDSVVYFGPEGCAGLAVDPISAPLLTGSVVSFEDTMASRRFLITNPNAVAGCGCGVSFAV